MQQNLETILQELRPYARLIGEDPKTQSIEFRNVPSALRQRALAFQSTCPYDGATLTPFRARKHDSLRADPADFPAGSLYFAPSCQGRTCYQSKATSEFKQLVRNLYSNEMVTA